MHGGCIAAAHLVVQPRQLYLQRKGWAPNPGISQRCSWPVAPGECSVEGEARVEGVELEKGEEGQGFDGRYVRLQ